eukprot:666310-Pyramimonas_sp.AAC.1
MESLSEPSWGLRGASWAVLMPSWAVLGPSWVVVCLAFSCCRLKRLGGVLGTRGPSGAAFAHLGNPG